jgi:cysteate synthase
LLVVPAQALERMRFPARLDPCVRLLVLDGAATHNDAIACAEVLARLPGHHSEGGARNVGRRDGLGTVMLAAAEAIGRLPRVYVQAVGSGAGAIGAHEAALRIRSGREALPRLLLCQNAPFAPLYEAWRCGGTAPADRELEPLARELINRRPPFAVCGGVRDVLMESDGDVRCADNASVLSAMALFEEAEGIDIEPSAGVALAALAEAARSGDVGRDELVLLNITGGGRARQARDLALVSADPWLRVDWPGGEDGPRIVVEQMARALAGAGAPAEAAR